LRCRNLNGPYILGVQKSDLKVVETKNRIMIDNEESYDTFLPPSWNDILLDTTTIRTRRTFKDQLSKMRSNKKESHRLQKRIDQRISESLFEIESLLSESPFNFHTNLRCDQTNQQKKKIIKLIPRNCIDKINSYLEMFDRTMTNFERAYNLNMHQFREIAWHETISTCNR